MYFYFWVCLALTGDLYGIMPWDCPGKEPTCYIGLFAHKRKHTQSKIQNKVCQPKYSVSTQLPFAKSNISRLCRLLCTFTLTGTDTRRQIVTDNKWTGGKMWGRGTLQGANCESRNGRGGSSCPGSLPGITLVSRHLKAPPLFSLSVALTL